MSHDTQKNYYTNNYALMQHHKYSLEELENMIRFERDIYISLLAEHIEKENEKVRQQNAKSQMRKHG